VKEQKRREEKRREEEQETQKYEHILTGIITIILFILEKLVVAQIVHKFPTYNRASRFIATSTRARNNFLCCQVTTEQQSQFFLSFFLLT
jgi:hypothetical protein